MQLPEQLLVLHRQALVDLGLLLQRLLEFGLFAGELPAGGDREPILLSAHTALPGELGTVRRVSGNH